jgi:diaminopimelate decarboxylase
MKSLRDKIEQLLREPVVPADVSRFLATLGTLPSEAFLRSVELHGSPQYFLDLDALRQRALFFSRTMRSALPRCESFYAFKCNDLPVLVRTLKEEGFHADVAGGFELQLALNLGFDRILFSSPGKSHEELALALAHRDRVVLLVDNFEELDALIRMLNTQPSGPPVRIGFRLNLSVHHGAAWSKFGITLDDLPRAVSRVEACPTISFIGLHVHASWNKTPARYVEHLQLIAAFLSTLAPDRLRNLEFVDLGGGFYPEGQANLLKGEDKGVLHELLASRHPGENELPELDPHAFVVTPVDSLHEFARQIGECANRVLLPLLPNAAIYFEPGRFLATHPTSLLLTVTATKGDCVVVDGGIHMLGDYKFSEYAHAPILNLTRPSTQWHKRTIFGPLCDPHDLVGYSHYGEELQEGDVIAVLHQGAYTFSTAWRFIKPVPPYVAWDGENLFVAKKRERFEDRYSGCVF